MVIKTMAGFVALLFLSHFMPVSSAMAVSPSPAIVNSTLTVSGLPAGANVQFILNEGVPVFAVADAGGKARYLPLLKGSLEIIVRQNGIKIDETSVSVLPGTTPGPNTTATPAATAASRPGTGGGGGGGMTASEPNENIEKTERIEKSLISNIPVTYDFTVPGIYQIVVTGTDNENLISIKVEALKATSKLISTAPPGMVFRNLNIWADTKRIKKAVIRFRIENTWMQSSNLAGSDIKMLRWDGAKWAALETKETGKDGTYTSFEATTDALSSFAIIGLKGQALPTVQAAGVTQTAVNPETTNAEVPVPKTGGFEIIAAITAFCMLYMRRKR